MKKNNVEQVTALVVELCKDNNELTVAILNALVELVENGIESDPEPVSADPEPAIVTPKHFIAPVAESEHWYDAFKSEFTTVRVKGSTVQVTIKRGHASEWKQQLRDAGFKWSRGNRNYWAYLDDEKRAAVAARNAEIDAQTEGMTPEQRRAYWAEKRAARNVA